MKKSDLDKVIAAIKVQDLNGKCIVLEDMSVFSQQDIQSLHDGLKDTGVAAVVCLPPGAKYDIQTKEQLKKMVNAL
jgi:hypothetical protein